MIDVPTSYSSEYGTEHTTSEGTLDPDQCLFDQIVALLHCENEVSSTSIFMCLGAQTPLSDQFWVLSDMLQAYERYQDRDYGWVHDVASRNIETTGLPNRMYILEFFLDDRGLIMDGHPLLALLKFSITCGVPAK